MALETDQTTDHAHVRALIDDWVQAVRDKNINRLLTHYAPDMVSFDAWGGLQNPLAVVREHWEQCFAGHEGPIRFEHHDQHLAVGDTVAFYRCLIHMAGTLKDGTQHSFWGRGTICFQKIDGRWLVTHEHASAPFDPMTGKACTDLKP